MDTFLNVVVFTLVASELKADGLGIIFFFGVFFFFFGVFFDVIAH